jgi:hypothetical protein
LRLEIDYPDGRLSLIYQNSLGESNENKLKQAIIACSQISSETDLITSLYLSSIIEV